MGLNVRGSFLGMDILCWVGFTCTYWVCFEGMMERMLGGNVDGFLFY